MSLSVRFIIHFFNERLHLYRSLRQKKIREVPYFNMRTPVERGVADYHASNHFFTLPWKS